MKRTWILGLALAVVAPIGFVGCGEETTVETTKKIDTPDGSVTKTDTSTIEKTGDAKDEP